MKMKHLIIPSLLAITLAACNNAEVDTKPVDDVKVEAPTKATLGTFGLALENMDKTVSPGENFFEYMNGTWLKNTEIPADRSRYGGFGILADLSEERVRGIINEVSTKTGDLTSDEQKIRDFYNAFMDEDAIEAAGLAPIQPGLAKIRGVKTGAEAMALMSNPELGIRSTIASWVGVDLKDNENYIVYLSQAGLGMPNRNYYLDDDEKSVGLRADYKTYLETMLGEAGLDNVSDRADAIMAFETKLAEVHWTPVQRRDRTKTYNKRTLAELTDMAPGVPWDAYFGARDLSDQTKFIVREVDAIEGTAKIFADADIDVLRDYMTVSYIGGHSEYLPKSIDDASFAFYNKALRGQEEQRERWKRGVAQINGTMGEVVGKVYVERYFPESSKEKMMVLIENLRSAFKDGIDNLEWMGEETKEQAQYKLAKFNPKIGYPDVWTDYSDLTVDRDDLIGTVKSARAWGWQEDLDKLGGPIDRDEWGMTPQTVNAYYRADLNEIVFPAAILQAPFFDPNADDAVNYGGIGAVIGHEMGHGFDDQGRKTDGDGVQRDWWTEEDAKGFEARSSRLGEQYDKFEPLPGEFINGKLSMGENIGDLTGVTMAYEAYKRSLGGKPAPVIDGLTGDQRFFLAWAQIWQIKYRDEAMSAQLKNGPHSPGEYRANGIVRNIDAWYEAFDIQPSDPMYIAPENRVKIW